MRILSNSFWHSDKDDRRRVFFLLFLVVTNLFIFEVLPTRIQSLSTRGGIILSSFSYGILFCIWSPKFPLRACVFVNEKYTRFTYIKLKFFTFDTIYYVYTWFMLERGRFAFIFSTTSKNRKENSIWSQRFSG